MPMSIVEICNLKSIERVFNRYLPDAVILLAPEPQFYRYIYGPADCNQNNSVLSSTMLEVARNHE